MLFHCLLCQCTQFIAIECSRTWIILLLCIRRIAIVLTKELSRICIAAQLHLSQLNPCPVCVQICWSHKCQMYAQIPMYSWAINTNEYTVRHRWPRRIFCTAIKACLFGEKRKRRDTKKRTKQIKIHASIRKFATAYWVNAIGDLVHHTSTRNRELRDKCLCAFFLHCCQMDNDRMAHFNGILVWFTLLVAWARSRWKTASISLFDGPLVLAIFESQTEFNWFLDRFWNRFTSLSLMRENLAFWTTKNNLNGCCFVQIAVVYWVFSSLNLLVNCTLNR